jgi:hypothetical protein
VAARTLTVLPRKSGALSTTGIKTALGTISARSAPRIPWIAAHSSGETMPWFNVLIHPVCAGGVLILLLMPAVNLGQRSQLQYAATWGLEC